MLLDEGAELAESGGHHRMRAAADAGGHALRQAGNAYRRLADDLAAVGLQIAHQHP
jgi:hypothetical protein